MLISLCLRDEINSTYSFQFQRKHRRCLIQHMRRILRRIAVAVIATVLLLALAGFIGLHVRQRLLRRRAEKLVLAMQNMEVGKSNCHALPSLEGIPLERFGTVGSCEGENYFWSFDWVDLSFDSGWREKPERYRLFDRIRPAYFALGGRPFRITGDLRFRKGILIGKDLDVMILVPPDKEKPQIFQKAINEFASVVEKENRSESVIRPDIDMRQRKLHPSYSIYRGSSIIDGVQVSHLGIAFLPGAPKPDSRLTRFDLTCLTRWKPCTQTELMPGVAEQDERDHKQFNEGVDAQTCGPATFQAVAREAENAAVVEVVAPSESPNDPDYKAAVVSFRLVSNILRSRNSRDSWDQPGENRDIWIFDRAPGIKNLNVPQFKQGDRFIILFKARRSASGPLYWSYPCGVLPYNKENLAVARTVMK